MNPKTLKEAIETWTFKNCGNEKRFYLGMSGISQCPLRLLRRMTIPENLSLTAAKKFYEGYLAERDMIERLRAMNLYVDVDKNVQADFDSRYSGHIDGALSSGELLEIKSTHSEELLSIKQNLSIPIHHNVQVQAYMRHHKNGFRAAMLIYKARDTGDIFCYRVERNEYAGSRLDEKAKRILGHLDSNTYPECECGRCQLMTF